jgi:hypothetical protein
VPVSVELLRQGRFGSLRDIRVAGTTDNLTYEEQIRTYLEGKRLNSKSVGTILKGLQRRYPNEGISVQIVDTLGEGAKVPREGYPTRFEREDVIWMSVVFEFVLTEKRMLRDIRVIIDKPNPVPLLLEAFMSVLLRDREVTLSEVADAFVYLRAHFKEYNLVDYHYQIVDTLTPRKPSIEPLVPTRFEREDVIWTWEQALWPFWSMESALRRNPSIRQEADWSRSDPLNT